MNELWRESSSRLSGRVASRPPSDPAVFGVLWDEAVRQFEAHDGFPPAAVWTAKMIPARYVGRSTADTWLHFIVKRKPGRWPGTSYREVVVIEVTDSPPP